MVQAVPPAWRAVPPAWKVLMAAAMRGTKAVEREASSSGTTAVAMEGTEEVMS